jgi:hypothetical protein
MVGPNVPTTEIDDSQFIPHRPVDTSVSYWSDRPGVQASD